MNYQAAENDDFVECVRRAFRTKACGWLVIVLFQLQIWSSGCEATAIAWLSASVYRLLGLGVIVVAWVAESFLASVAWRKLAIAFSSCFLPSAGSVSANSAWQTMYIACTHDSQPASQIGYFA